MKRVKKFVALVAIAAITFGSTLSVFAEDTATTAYGNLDYTEKSWYYENAMYGVYPVVTGMDSLNEKIEEQIWKASLQSDNSFKVSYDVENADRYATILLSFDYDNPNRFIGIDTVAFWYFVDKETMAEISQVDYDSLVAEAAQAVEEEPVAPIASEEAAEEEGSDEAQMVAVRQYAEALGYSVEWSDTLNAVTLVSADGIDASFKVDVNEYTFGGEAVELESAPINQDGIVYVPASFFENLGAEVSYAADGSVSKIALPEGVVVTPVDGAEEDDADEAEAADDADTEEASDEANDEEVEEDTEE